MALDFINDNSPWLLEMLSQVEREVCRSATVYLTLPFRTTTP